MQLAVCVFLSKGPCKEYQGSHERTNVHTLCIRTEKDALNVPLKGPTGRIQNTPGYGVLLLSPDLLFRTD